MSFRITVTQTTLSFACREAQSVLAAMMANGADPIAVGCRSGGCGVCRVEVVSGAFRTGDMSGAQVDDEERARGIALACQLFPRSDLHVRVLGRRCGEGDGAARAVLERLTQRCFGS